MNLNEHKSFFHSPYFDLIIWLIFFVLTLLVILIVQLILLPYVFSDWHAGDGLLIGGDWLSFHRAALEIAEKISVDGWSAWELRPKGWMPAGVAGAIYALIWPQPWALAPLNAAVHAVTALMVIKILLLFTEERKLALIAALPFVFFPSAMLWYTQIHRDGYSNLGMLFFVYGFLLIIKDNSKGLSWHPYGVGFFSAMAGIYIIWLARPHQLVIYLFMGLFILSAVVFYLLVLMINNKVQWKQALSKILIIFLVVVLIYPFTQGKEAGKYQAQVKTEDIVENVDAKTYNSQEDYIYQWESVFWLPQPIDNQLYSLAYLRSVTFQKKYGETGSGIDYDLLLTNAYDFIYYLPRALQIAFFAPFPVEWFAQGSDGATTFFRRVSAFEMTFIYLMVIPFIYGIWLWKDKIEFYLIAFFCTIMMMPIVYGVPNVGTIYRYRYGFLMLLVALAVLALLRFGKERLKN